jgi:beta-glucosidase
MVPSAIYGFPHGFLWGCGTAAHQVEGSNSNNTWSAWEQQSGRIFNGDKAGLACDWWGGRWKEDFDRAKQSGQNSHRLSLEWSRIQPTPDIWSEDAIDYYRQILRGAVQRGLTPMITLHHFTDPLWFAEKGGWESPDSHRLFEHYVYKVVEALKEYTCDWVTINEPNVYTFSGYVEGTFPPGKTDLSAAGRVLTNLLRGHAAAYHTIHALQPEAKVGIATNYRSVKPLRKNFPPDRWMTQLAHNAFNCSFNHALRDGILHFFGRSVHIPEAVGTQDYIGINYYTRDLISFTLSPHDFFIHRQFPSGTLRSTNDFIANVPDGMFEALRWARQFNLPIIITENGVEDSHDSLRPEYLVDHIRQVWRAVNFNWYVKGYFYWSLVDNFEWERGWSQSFGLWGLDTTTQRRIHRPSVDLFAAICKQNGLSSETVATFAPQAFTRLFPG